jgi:hypothetical protein
LDGAELGKTPYTLRFKRTTELSLLHAGYRTQTLRVTPESDPTLVVELSPEKPRARAKPVVPRSEQEPAAPLERDVPASALAQPAVDDTWRVAEPDAPPLPAAEAFQRPEPEPQVAPARLEPLLEVSEHAPPPSAASETTRSTALDEPEPAYEVQETPSVTPGAPRHRPLREIRRSFGRFVDRLLGREAERARREAMLNEPLPYPNFPAAQRAYDERRIDLERYEDVLWVLKEKRRQRVEAERRNLWHGLITRPEFEARLDRIGAEFRGE